MIKAICSQCGAQEQIFFKFIKSDGEVTVKFPSWWLSLAEKSVMFCQRTCAEEYLADHCDQAPKEVATQPNPYAYYGSEVRALRDEIELLKTQLKDYQSGQPLIAKR